jgi:hypothetical protein
LFFFLFFAFFYFAIIYFRLFKNSKANTKHFFFKSK